MFNFEDVKEISPIAPGLKKEGCRLISVARNKDDDSVSFNFLEVSTGSMLTHREFKPKRGEQQTDEQYKKNLQLAVSRLAHIYRAFVSEEEFKAVKVDDPNNLAKAAENWMSVTKQMGLGLKKFFDNKVLLDCTLKVVLRAATKDGKTNWYSSLPQVPPFISTANHPKEFTVNPQYDIFEIPKVAANQEQAYAPAGQGAQQSAFAGTATPPAGNAASGNVDF